MSVVKFRGGSRGVPSFDALLADVPAYEEMEAEALQAFRSRVQSAIADLDAVEPADEESEAYEAWAEKHEDLEDILDEVLDLLEEME